MRLSRDTLDRLPAAVSRPDYAREEQQIGIVHLGLGAFHRAHQAMFTDGAMAAGDRDWAIAGVSLRSAQVHDALMPQDGLYTVTTRGGQGTDIRLIGAIRQVLVAPREPAAVTAVLAAPQTRVVTLTVTEKGYHLRPDGTLDRDAVAVAEDTIYDHLAAAFAARRDAGLPGLTLLSCDNIAANGRALGEALTTFLDSRTPALRGWFEEECTCPSSMVDRIVPALTEARLTEVSETLGLRDEGAVVTEPFMQWVIEDRFAGPRPRWEAAGAQFVTEVAPFETAKLRLLNGAHSALAYLGLAAGVRFVHEAIAHPAIRPTIERLMRDEAAPTIDPAPGQDLPCYIEHLLARFANPALPHRLDQIATDGSQKIAQRWLTPIAINHARGRASPATLRALAAWLLHVRGDRGQVSDPHAQTLAALWRNNGRDGIVDAVFGPGSLFSGADVSQTDRIALTNLLRTKRAPIDRHGDRSG